MLNFLNTLLVYCKKKYKILLILFLFSLYFIGYQLIGDTKYKMIKEFLPERVKSFLKETVYIIPTLQSKNLKLQDELTQTQNTIKTLNYSTEKIVNSFMEKMSNDEISDFILTLDNKDYYNTFVKVAIWTKLSKYFSANKELFYLNKNEDKKIIKSKTGNYMLEKFESYLLPARDNWAGKPVAYIDDFENKGLIVTGDGIFFWFDFNKLNNRKLKVETIPSNIRVLIDYEEFYKSSRHSVRDLLIFNEQIYISYVKEVSNQCYNISILSAKIDFNFLEFQEFFSYPDCNDKKAMYGEFAAYISGGRIFPFKEDKLLLSIGVIRDYRVNSEKYHETVKDVAPYAQNKNKLFGKIISIDQKSKNYNILSMGHRNPQGLYYNKDKNIIINSEHGPEGGDEININFSPDTKEIENYGWPIASYGTHYDYKFREEAPLHNSHSKYGFIEPIRIFTEAIGPSEIIKIPNEFDQNFTNDYMLASMGGSKSKGGRSIYHLRFDNDFKKIIFEERIPIGERIRDMLYRKDQKKIILILEGPNMPSVAILSKVAN